MKNKKFIVVFIALAVISGLIIGCKGKIPRQQTEQTQATKYWTCGMHPSVRVSDAEYKKGKVNCPICNMPLIPVEEKVTSDQRTVTNEKKIEEAYYGCGIKEEGHCPKCDEGKSDANCICKEHSFMLKAKAGEKLYCPICKVELKEIKPEEIKTIVKEENILSRVKLSPRQTELAGVVTVPVKKRHLTKEIKTVGRIAFDPELRIAQEEFLTALQTRQKVSESPDPDVISRAEDLLEKSRLRLRLLGMSDGQISELEVSKTAQTNLVLPEDKVWVYADIYEYELSWIKIGQAIKATSVSFPAEEFLGNIVAIDPVLNPMTRSVRIRAELDNPELKLKPEMYVDVHILVDLGEVKEKEVLAIPRDAVLDTGLRKVVWVDVGEGMFHGREVVVGPEAISLIEGKRERFYPVIKGLNEGELVVTHANFLIDSQSQIAGPAEAVYGGALVTVEEKEKTGPVHRH